MKNELLVAIFTVGLAVALPGSAAAGGEWPDLPQVSYAIHHDTSPPLARMAAAMPGPPLGLENRVVPLRVPADLASRARPVAPVIDPVLDQGAGLTSLTPTPGISFEGQSDDENELVLGTRYVPPDANGDVGLTHYVQAVNIILSAYDKSTGTRTFGPVPINSLWVGFGGPCETNNDGDPIVLYDDAADRWMVSQFALTASGHQCIAVSTTSAPDGSYHRYDFLVSPGTDNDYPKFGIWPDAYYMTANQFNFSGFQGALAVAFERDKMLLGQAAQMVKFGPLACGSECFFSLQPSHWEGGIPPPAAAPNTFIMAFDDETWGTGANPDGYRLWEFTVDWAIPGSSTLIALPQVDAPEFDANLCNFSRACIPQPGPGERLDSLSQFTMYRAQYRNLGSHESLVVNHTVDVNGHNWAGVRWAELRDTGSGLLLYQTGTIAPNADHRWMGSIAMDKAGDIAVGYSVSNKKTKPSIRYVTRSAGDPLGTMGSEVTLHAGTGVQQSSNNRWGDYSSMSVDPADDCTFWYTQEYYANNGSYDFKTRIGSFKVPSCN